MPTKMPSPNNAKTHRALVGLALHALRAYAKAYKMRAGCQDVFRYEILPDDSFGMILDPEGKMVAYGTLEEWAELGRPMRSALLALKYLKERIEEAYELSSDMAQVNYLLDALAGTASLSVQGVPLTRDDLLQRARHIWLSEAAICRAANLSPDELHQISGWAKLGMQLEIDYYRALHGAERYELDAAVIAERQRGYRLGIFRRKLDEVNITSHNIQKVQKLKRP